MVAILIIGTCFIGLVQAFPYGLRIVNSAENRSRASYLAQEKIEELISEGYDGVATGTIEIKAPLAASGYLASFERETTVEYVDENLNATTTDLGLKKITTTVYYTDSIDKQEKAYTLYSLLSSRAPI